MSKKQFALPGMILLTVLAGCQPDTAQQAAQPVAAPAPVASAPVAAPPAVQATAPGSRELQLAQASKCFSCHAIDRKLVGPAWKDVAAKYRGQKDAAAKLAEKVAKGGSGAWGAVPMPPNSPQVSKDDIDTLVHFILGLS